MDVAASTDMVNWIFHRELNSHMFTKVCEQEESKNSMSQYCTLRPFHNQKMLTACVCLSIKHNVAAGFLEICFCLDLMCENVNAKGNL